MMYNSHMRIDKVSYCICSCILHFKPQLHNHLIFVFKLHNSYNAHYCIQHLLLYCTSVSFYVQFLRFYFIFLFYVIYLLHFPLVLQHFFAAVSNLNFPLSCIILLHYHLKVQHGTKGGWTRRTLKSTGLCSKTWKTKTILILILIIFFFTSSDICRVWNALRKKILVLEYLIP